MTTSANLLSVADFVHEPEHMCPLFIAGEAALSRSPLLKYCKALPLHSMQQVLFPYGSSRAAR